MAGVTTILKTSLTKYGLGVCAFAALSGGVSAQKPSYAERGLIGVNLYDSGVKVVSLYGSPDEIQAVNLSSTSTNSGGGGQGGSGGPGSGFGGRAPATGSGPSRTGADWSAPFGFGNDVLRQTPTGPAAAGAPISPEGGPGSGGGRPGTSGSAPPSSVPGGGAPGATSGTTPTEYTRWVYNRAGSKYGFIVDNQGRVVQIEAIGMQNNRVKTRKGLGFGATFAQIIKTYGNPDGYEVGGDTILVKYLVNKKVAFRLTRLAAKKPHVVTGVVVSAGKV